MAGFTSITPIGDAPPEALAPRPMLSLVAPVYDERDCIERFVAEVCNTFADVAIPYELICVDDGSSDGTDQLLCDLCERFPGLRPLVLDGHHGQSAAIAAGVSRSSGEYVALIDADLQNDPADLVRMIALLSGRDDYAGVVGVRTRRKDSWLRRVSSRTANWAASKITGDVVRDAGCGIKVFRGDVLRGVTFFRGAHRFLQTLTALQGERVLQIEVNHRPRLLGRSKYGNGLGRTFIALRDALGVRWLRDRQLRYRVRTLEPRR